MRADRPDCAAFGGGDRSGTGRGRSPGFRGDGRMHVCSYQPNDHSNATVNHAGVLRTGGLQTQDDFVNGRKATSRRPAQLTRPLRMRGTAAAGQPESCVVARSGHKPAPKCHKAGWIADNIDRPVADCMLMTRSRRYGRVKPAGVAPHRPRVRGCPAHSSPGTGNPPRSPACGALWYKSRGEH